MRFLFLDSNDLVYREGNNLDEVAIEHRAHAQMEWLTRELSNPSFGPDATTIVVMHHPLFQSSAKHRDQARELWDYRFHGKRLADVFADGGVDLVLTGHTHTYERFRVTRRDGRGFHLVNLSGKPEPWFLWFGDGARRAQNLEGDEEAWLYEKGWGGLTGWTVTQDEVMAKKEVDQLGLFTIDAEGGVTLSISYLGRASMEPPVRLLWGERSGTPGSVRLKRQK